MYPKRSLKFLKKVLKLETPKGAALALSGPSSGLTHLDFLLWGRSFHSCSQHPSEAAWTTFSNCFPHW